MSLDWLFYLPAAARRGLYFGLHAAIGSRVPSVWNEFLAWERLSPAALEKAVEEKLSRLLEASSGSEYYRSLKVSRGCGESVREWLKRFPVLERGIVRENFARLVTDKLRAQIPSPEAVPPRGYTWVMVKTGGTTGMPTTVVHDATARDWGRVTRLYGQRQCLFPLGTRYIKLWGSERDLFKQQAALEQRMLRALHGEIPLNAFRAKEEDLMRHLAVMRSNPHVKHLMAYVDAAAGLAMFIREKKLTPPQFDSLMACAGTVTSEYRKLLEETFSAQVFDKYGSRECSDMACECSHHTGMHVYSPHVFIEIVDENGNECAPGRPGRILVTCLNNTSFPMIRYDIGDTGAWASQDKPCPCGSAFPRMQSVLGRQDDMLVTEDGTLQSSSFVRHFVGVSLNWQLIREWQLEQTGKNRFVFRYVPLKAENLEENLRRLEESFRLVFGASAEVEMVRVSEIPPSASGKIQWIINRYRKP